MWCISVLPVKAKEAASNSLPVLSQPRKTSSTLCTSCYGHGGHPCLFCHSHEGHSCFCFSTASQSPNSTMVLSCSTEVVIIYSHWLHSGGLHLCWSCHGHLVCHVLVLCSKVQTQHNPGHAPGPPLHHSPGQSPCHELSRQVTIVTIPSQCPSGRSAPE